MGNVVETTGCILSKQRPQKTVSVDKKFLQNAQNGGAIRVVNVEIMCLKNIKNNET